MKHCKRCGSDKFGSDFYSGDNTCKECRKAMVRANRAKNVDYYREYDKRRYQEDPNVRKRHRRYQATDGGRQAIEKSRRKYIEQNPAKRAAHVILGNAVRDGKVKKPSFCEECGSGKGGIHGHHDDYAHPLSVRWLCPACHKAWHDKHGEAPNGSHT